MWHITKLTELIGIKYPIIQAPMAGGATTAELVSSVSNAGGLGSLGAGYMSPDNIRNAIKKIRCLTDQPFAVNLFIPQSHTTSSKKMQIACNAIKQCAAELAVEVKPVSAPFCQLFEEQVQILIEEKIPVFSFTFGIPCSDIIKKFKDFGSIIIGTATTVDEGKLLEKNGIDIIVAQGSEAGGHRGSFLDEADNSLIPISTLINQLKESVNVPIVASGGIMNGRKIVKMLHSGASAVQMGTAFLCCDETGIHPQYKKLLLKQKKDNTVLTRAFSGKLARGINNKFITCMADELASILDYPIQNKLTGQIRQKAKEINNTDYMSMWAGQAAYLSRDLNAKKLFNALIDEAERYYTEINKL
ncbi:MAG: nitronate monooxygenase [Pseudomonadota bacterium]